MFLATVSTINVTLSQISMRLPCMKCFVVLVLFSVRILNVKITQENHVCLLCGLGIRPRREPGHPRDGKCAAARERRDGNGLGECGGDVAILTLGTESCSPEE